jgi:hypothetical protein
MVKRYPQKISLNELLKAVARRGNHRLKSSAHFFYERRNVNRLNGGRKSWVGKLPFANIAEPEPPFFYRNPESNAARLMFLASSGAQPHQPPGIDSLVSRLD